MSEEYESDNLLDNLSDPETLAAQYERGKRRERELLDAHLGLTEGRAIAIGCGWHPGRHLLPKPQWHLTAVDVDGDRPKEVVRRGDADEGFAGKAGHLHDVPDASFDVVLYRLVLHHVAFVQPLLPVFVEAARLLKPGGALVAIEPNVRYPVGAGLALANKLGLGTKVHGTPDDIPLSPGTLKRDARAAGLTPELHTVSFTWRRMPPAVQERVGALDRLGSLPVARSAGHTVMLIARK